jgi:dTMP kinase
MSKNGLLIAIEGIDGSGKSTLAKELYNHLCAKNIQVLLTKEPGDTPLGKEIRSLVQEQHVAICPKAEYLLFAADRAQHAQQVILPALAQGKVVISDRMGDSSIAYQGYARGLEIDMIKMINRWALNECMPDLTIFVKIDPTVARQRYIERSNHLSAFEKEEELFMRKIHDGFCDLYKNRSDVIIIDGNQNRQSVVEQTLLALMPRLATL